jgi:hypothetical protein
MDEMNNDATKLIQRETPEPAPARAALVKQWQDEVRQAKEHWKKPFERMRRNMKFAGGEQWLGQKEDDDRYMANITQRVLKATVSALYAKNPTIVMKRRKKLDFKIWDGKPESLMMAQQAIQAAQQAKAAQQGAMQTEAEGLEPAPPAAPPVDPAMVQQAVALMADIQEGSARREMLDRIGKTLVILAEYYKDEATPGFKLQMKQMIRRARTTGVGYVKLGFQRAMELSEGQAKGIADMAERLAVIGQLQADITDGETDPYAAEVEELRLATAAIQSEPEVIVREGPVFGFPHSTRLIPSISTEKLMGWVGSEWLAEEILMTPDRVKQVYGVDIGQSFTAYRVVGGSPETGNNRRMGDSGKGKGGLACIWHIYDKATGLEYIVAEGHPDFLREPASPSVFIEQFFPYFAVTFNDMESEGELFPKSDVELLKHIQKEYNRTKESLRQHRIANRPLYLAPGGIFEEEEAKSLQKYGAHDVIIINAIDKGMKSQDVLMPVQKIGVDPNLYETAGLFEDMQRVSGNQEATIGGTGSGTATESNIAEQGRQGSLGLDSDDLDEMLAALFRAMGQVMLTELDEATVQEIVGPGAIWPVLTRLEVMKEIGLEVKAGSSGRPNQARDAATFERIYPLLIQVPGISPRWLAEVAIRIADDDVSLEDAIIDGLPSIVMQNSMKQQAAGDPAADPSQQGDKGGDKNTVSKPGGTAQPGFPGAGAGGALQ